MKKSEIIELGKYILAGIAVGACVKAVVYAAVKAAEAKTAAKAAPAAEPADETVVIREIKFEDIPAEIRARLEK
jgi:hypothetical protein